MISTKFYKSCIKKMLDYVIALAMMFVFVSGVLAQPSGQTQALYFNPNTGNMYLWSGSVDNHNIANSFLGSAPSAATTVATSANYSGSYSWNSATRTLTLTNFKYTTSHCYAMYVDAPGMTIELVGENTLISTYKGAYISAGIYIRTPSQPVDGRIAYIKGTGTLNVQSGDVDADRSAGLYSFWGLEIDGNVTINARGGTGLISNGMFVWDILKINGGIINAYGGPSNGLGTRGESTGISAELGLLMTEGKVYADCKDANMCSSGFWSWTGTIKINGGVFISRGYKGAVYGNNKATPPGSDIIFPPEGYVVWHNQNFDYEPVESDQINSESYTYSPNDRYVKFINYGIDDIKPPVWMDGQKTDLTPPTVFSGGRTVNHLGWFISDDGVTNWLPWTVPTNASMDLNGKYICYKVSMQYIGELETNVVQITVIPNELIVTAGAGGTVSGTPSGRYPIGTPINVTATADTGYSFTNWNVTGATITGGNTVNPAAFSMPANAVTLIANFALKTHTIAVSANPPEGGAVTGGGNYTYGASVTVKATANEGYNFVEWTENGARVSGDASYQFTAEGDRNLVAKFTKKTYTVAVASNNSDYGTATGGGTFEHGTVITVTAAHIAPYEFVYWEDENGKILSTDEKYEFTVTENVNLTAYFRHEEHFINIVINPAGTGTVAGDRTFSSAQNVSFTAGANEGYEFVNWTIDGEIKETNPTYNFLFAADKDITLFANFELKPHTVSVSANPDEGGIVTGGGRYIHDASVTVTATAKPGWNFAGWNTNGVSINPPSASYTFPATGDADLVANFVPNPFTVGVMVNNPDYGEIEGKGSIPFFEAKMQGDKITAKAIAKQGYEFVNWVDDKGTVVSTTELTAVITDNTVLTANFKPEGEHFVTVVTNPAKAGMLTGGGSYANNAEVTVTAAPETGYEFVNWTKDGNEVGTQTAYKFSVTEDVVLTANFKQKPYDITVEANPAGAGTLTGDGQYLHGTPVTVTATAGDGYAFVGWMKDGTQVSTEPNYTFTAIENAHLVANFAKKTYTVTVKANNTQFGNVTGGGTFDYGTKIPFTAVPTPSYRFVNWTEQASGAVVSTAENFTYTVTKDVDLIANFIPGDADLYFATIETNPPGAGTVTGGGSYTLNAGVTVTAAPAIGYKFVNWTGDKNSAATAFNFAMPANDVVLTANFELKTYDITVKANPAAGGTVSGGGTGIPHGTSVTVKATPEEGYEFVNWTREGASDVQFSTDAEYTFTAIEDMVLVATFAKKTYPVTYSSTGDGTLSVTAGGKDIANGEKVEHGTVLTITATPGTDCHIDTLTVNGANFISGNTYTVISATDIAAIFSIDSYTVTALANPAAGGVVTGGGTYSQGENATVKAIPNAGYEFVNWITDNKDVYDTPDYSFSVTKNVVFVANFALKKYTVAVSASPDEGGVVTGGGRFIHGESVTVEATPNAGYDFAGWTENGAKVSEDLSYRFDAESDRNLVANFTKKTYAVTVIANNPDYGTVTGGGTNIPYGTKITVTATPEDDYYRFVNWTSSNDTVVSTPEYTFTVTEDVVLTANFKIKDVAFVTTVVNPAGAGTTTGSGAYFQGEEVTLTATASTGYDFASWTKDGVVVSTSPAYKFNAEEDVTMSANFTPKPYTVSVSANPVEGGDVTGGGTYSYKATATVTATAKPGWEFANWTVGGEFVSSSKSYTFPVSGDVALVANFVPLSYSVIAIVNNPDYGTVTGGGSSFIGSCSYGYEVSVEATANPGYEFVNWKDESGTIVSTAGNYTFTVTKNVNLVANFKPKEKYFVTVAVNPEGAGTVTGGGTYTHDDAVTVTTTPNAGYTFVNWTKGDQIVETGAAYQFAMPANDVVLTANFTRNAYDIAVKANPAEGGTVSGGGTGILHGASVTVEAIPSKGYEFVSWTKEGAEDMKFSTSEKYTFTAIEDIVLVATFVKLPDPALNVTALANPAAGGVVTGGGTYSQGENVTVKAIPNAGYEFVNWLTDNGDVYDTPDYSFSITKNVVFVANFALKRYTVAVSANPAEGGAVTGGGRFIHGESVTVTATSNEGYDFAGWTENGAKVSENLTYQFDAESDRNLIANFTKKTYTVTVIANNPDYGTVTGGGTNIPYGTEITVMATPEDGSYKFVDWVDDKGKVISTANYTFIVTDNAILTANFKIKDVAFVTTVVNPAGAGTTTGSGAYLQGEEVALTATASTGYDFASWTKEGVVVSTSPAYKFNAEEDVTMSANFTPKPYTVSVSANPAEGGDVTGGGTYSYKATATVTATAKPGWEFANWTVGGEFVSSSKSYTFPVNGDVALIANFAPLSYTVIAMVNDPAYGTITAGGSSFIGNHSYGDKITLEATANPGYEFVNWTDENGGIVTDESGEFVKDANYTFVVTGNAVLTANFKPVTMYFVTIIINPEGAGTVAGVRPFLQGENIYLRAAANQGYELENWTLESENGEVISELPLCVLKPDGNVTLYVNFTRNSYNVSVEAIPTEGGNVTGGGTYNHGDDVTVTATAKEGYRFVNWVDGNGVQFSTTPSYTFTAIEDVDLVANFEKKTYPVIFNVVGNNGALTATANSAPITSGALVEHGANILFTALPQSGYIVKEWTLNGTVVAGNTTNTLTIDNLSAPATVTVEFAGDDTGIDICVDCNGGGGDGGSGGIGGGGVPVEPDPDGEDGLSFIAVAPCGETSVEVTVTPKDPNAKVFIDGVEENPHTVNLPNFGNNPFTIKVIAESGKEQEYTLKINRLVPFEQLVVMRWNNTLSIINNSENNGSEGNNGFIFKSFRWFYNGQELQQYRDKQWWSAGKSGEFLDTEYEYYVEVETEDGIWLRSCPAYITLRSMEVKAYPNPVAVAKTLYIDADVDQELLEGAVIEVYDPSGNRVDYLKVQGRLTPVNVRYSSGAYIFVLKGKDGFAKKLKVVVKD